MIDYTYMSLGGGVQSGTMAEMIAEGELDRPDIVIFADTKDEPDYVYRYVEYLRGRLLPVGVEVVTVSAGNLVDNLMSGTKRFAAIPAFTIEDGKGGRQLKRQCTTDFKIEPIEHEVRRRLLDHGMATRLSNGSIRINRGISVNAWLGISLDEVARMKPSRTAWITNRWPLIERRMSRGDCITWLKRHNLPLPRKSSCRICPYRRNSDWRQMRDNEPEDWAWAVNFDRSLRDNRAGRFASTAHHQLFLHKSCVPLDTVDLRTPEERGQLRLFEDEGDMCDEGYCFI